MGKGEKTDISFRGCILLVLFLPDIVQLYNNSHEFDVAGIIS